MCLRWRHQPPPAQEQCQSISLGARRVRFRAILSYYMRTQFSIREATEADVPLIFWFIRELAAYERLSHEVTASEDLLRRNLFTGRQGAEVLLAYEAAEAVGFALFFHNFSTFVGKPGLYLEDLVHPPRVSGARLWQSAHGLSGAPGHGARLRPVRVVGAGLE